MKCPKCNYLGFETGDRCKNCAYDFSLIGEADIRIETELDIELALRASDDTLPANAQWDDKFEQVDADRLADTAALAETPATLDIAAQDPEPSPTPARERPARLRQAPPFGPATLFADTDEPLIKVPAAPRAPLAVRRTPDTPRLRAVPRPVPRPSRPIDEAPVLDFVDERPGAAVESIAAVRARTVSHLASKTAPIQMSGPGARLSAAAIDHLLLGAVDLVVVYFTLRMTGLMVAELAMLPVAPLGAFLLLVKLSYFCAFTAVGGQTIGKMAMRIRVVTAEDEIVRGPVAVKRSLAGVVSAATLGLGYVLALVGPDRLALHDRLTHTRVIVVPSA
jgi:uncharacterized RDD family membrane protein YckC